ncbi:hypothetical protein MUN81_08610 [Hymenobacter sp. 5317J-9]|uniref:hypothetical protein n=1 Tax=Hymenobacter sp. 5317J-9 TaxID=2932250 RepID=UPI001FD67D08|nr:hypothetical protein [Hymenobacter sp. 5317J-9]UOQ99538.1 hypothetical protein MUN81_08610 [Hymenobacter sp. 5317J-9]
MTYSRAFSPLVSAVALFFLLSTATLCNGQSENLKTAYPGLKTLVYSHGPSGFESVSKCTPCILARYDKDGHLYTKAVQYTDCGVGFYNEYYPSGKLKITGQHRENDTGKWDDVYDRGLCWAKTGEWVFYSETGKVITKEYWKDGTFLKQVPERSLNEAWKINFILNGNILEKDARISMSDINNLTIVPVFKNKSNNKPAYCSTLTISATGKVQIHVDFSENGKLETDVSALLKAKGYNDPSKISLYILTTNQMDNKQSWGHSFTFK